ncbi:cytochrome P450 [Actinomadura atramentaria]|uniref:cytochrome P450 n=1 Tax=Actinomadura atramentaria TaxID=1990 RepID=UPI0003778DE7|nr:cytochrome P450 [Actinomadura atramentaria]
MIEYAAAETARVQGWDACVRALSASGLVSDAGPAEGNNMLLMEGATHRTLRRLTRAQLSRPHLAAVAEHLDATAGRLVAAALGDPAADLVADVAEPLVLDAILSVLGVPDERRARLAELTRSMLGLLEPDLPPERRRAAANAALRATLLFERDARAGRAAGFHAVLEAAAAAGEIPVKTARSTPVVMLHGGYENPLNQLGCLAAWAVADPERFAAAADAAPAAVFEEVLRAYSPVRAVARWDAADGGRFVWVDLHSANHDERRFPSPDAVDPAREPGHLGFGYGRHACPGAALARLEGRALLRALRRVPAAALRAFTVQWRDGLVARGPRTITRR